jgi:hypothetical protein
MKRVGIFTGLLVVALVGGCATEPMGPTAHVLPAQGKPFEVFAGDQATCKQFAQTEVGGGATMSNLKQFGAAALSIGLGAGLGAAIHNTRGAEIGGALGGVAGAAMGSRGSGQDQHGLQGRYDLAYTQCMYSRGNQIAGMASASPRVASGPSRGNPMQQGGGYPGSSPGPNYAAGGATYGAPWTQ